MVIENRREDLPDRNYVGHLKTGRNARSGHDRGRDGFESEAAIVRYNPCSPKASPWSEVTMTMVFPIRCKRPVACRPDHRKPSNCRTADR
jgi:hypothetical protein